MARRKKVAAPQQSKRQQTRQEHEEDDEEESEEEETNNNATSAEVQVEFEFHEPDEDDFHGVRDLLSRGSLSFTGLDLSGLADSIVGQVNIGTMVKSGSGEGLEDSDEDHALCGMLTVLNLSQFSEQSWLRTLRETLLLKSHNLGNPDIEKQLKRCFEASSQDRCDGGQTVRQVGLLVSERFINLPLDLIPALHKAVLEDIEWSCTTPECPPEEKPFYEFTHFLAITCCQSASSSAPAASTVARQGTSALLFSRPEDASYARAAQFLFSFPLPKKDTADKVSDGSAQTECTGKRKRKSVSDGGSSSSTGANGPQDRVAVFGITRKAFERVALGLRKSLSEIE